MRITEIAPPGREKQVKKLKKKFDDPGAPYAIAWAQHNKHGKPKKNEGKMSDIDIDIKTMSDTEFEKKYGKSKAQLQKDLKEAFNSERDEVKAILDKYGIKNADDVELGSDVYDELFGYYMDSGEMPYGVMKARTGMPDEWIADRLDDLGLVEQVQEDVNEADLNAWYAEQYARELAEKDGKSWDRMSYGDKEDYRKIANKKYGVVKSEGL